MFMLKQKPHINASTFVEPNKLSNMSADANQPTTEENENSLEYQDFSEKPYI